MSEGRRLGEKPTEQPMDLGDVLSNVFELHPIPSKLAEPIHCLVNAAIAFRRAFVATATGMDPNKNLMADPRYWTAMETVVSVWRDHLKLDKPGWPMAPIGVRPVGCGHCGKPTEFLASFDTPDSEVAATCPACCDTEARKSDRSAASA